MVLHGSTDLYEIGLVYKTTLGKDLILLIEDTEKSEGGISFVPFGIQICIYTYLYI